MQMLFPKIDPTPSSISLSEEKQNSIIYYRKTVDNTHSSVLFIVNIVCVVLYTVNVVCVVLYTVNIVCVVLYTVNIVCVVLYTVTVVCCA